MRAKRVKMKRETQAAFLMIVFSFLFLACAVQAQEGGAVPDEVDVWENRFVALFMIVMGVAMIGIWTRDFLTRDNLKGNPFKIRGVDDVMWPHFFAEALTATGLIIGGIGLYQNLNWSRSLAFAALGALAYAGLNSTSWAFFSRERYPYVVPMLIGFFGALAAIAILF